MDSEYPTAAFKAGDRVQYLEREWEVSRLDEETLELQAESIVVNDSSGFQHGVLEMCRGVKPSQVTKL